MSDDDRIKILEETCAALEKRVTELESMFRGALSCMNEKANLDAAMADASSEREVVVVGIGAAIRPLVECLPAAQRATFAADRAADGSAPADFLAAVINTVPQGDGTRRVLTEATEMAREYGITWAEIGIAP